MELNIIRSLFTLSVYKLPADLWVLFKCPFKIIHHKKHAFCLQTFQFFFYYFFLLYLFAREYCIVYGHF